MYRNRVTTLFGCRGIERGQIWKILYCVALLNTNMNMNTHIALIMCNFEHFVCVCVCAPYWQNNWSHGVYVEFGSVAVYVVELWLDFVNIGIIKNNNKLHDMIFEVIVAPKIAQ